MTTAIRKKRSDALPEDERLAHRKASSEKYRKAHPDRCRAARKSWEERNPEQAHQSKVDCRVNGRAYARAAKDIPCVDCGGKFPVVCMDFDHREGTVKHPRLTHRENGYRRMPISMTALATQSLKAFKEEVAKCDVVCANCHRIRTDRRRCGDHKLDECK